MVMDITDLKLWDKCPIQERRQSKWNKYYRLKNALFQKYALFKY